MEDVFLLIDIGNSVTKLALCGRGRILPLSVIRNGTAGITREAACALVERLCVSGSLAGAVGASVVPAVNAVWAHAVKARSGLDLQWVRHELAWNFKWRYSHPETLGADRIVNLCAARLRYQPPLLVLDFGSALTIDALNGDNEFTGGMIAPGFGAFTESLTARTALLPSTSLRIGRPPSRSCGRNTLEAMRLGLLHGYRGMVRELIAVAAAPLGDKVKLCATGGYAAAVMKCLPDLRCRVHAGLTLEGLASFAESVQSVASRKE